MELALVTEKSKFSLSVAKLTPCYDQKNPLKEHTKYSLCKVSFTKWVQYNPNYLTYEQIGKSNLYSRENLIQVLELAHNDVITVTVSMLKDVMENPMWKREKKTKTNYQVLWDTSKRANILHN